MNKTAWVLAGWVIGASAVQAADGAGVGAESQSWARWQGRVSFGAPAPTWRAGLAGQDQQGQKLSSLSLMGDYYFAGALAGAGSSVGGFRATGGVLLGPRSQLWTGQPGAASGGMFSIGSRVPGVEKNLRNPRTRPRGEACVRRAAGKVSTSVACAIV